MENLPFILTSRLPSATATTSSNHPCPFCPKSFAKPSALKPHLYTHTGEKPYQCHITGCLRRFAVLSNLRRHLKTHNKKRTMPSLSSSDRTPQHRHHHHHYPGTLTGRYGTHHQQQHIPSLLPQVIPLRTSSPLPPPPEVMINTSQTTQPHSHHLPRRLQPIAVPQPLTVLDFPSPMLLQTQDEGEQDVMLTQTLLMMNVMGSMNEHQSAYPLMSSSTSDQIDWPGIITSNISLSENNSNISSSGTNSSNNGHGSQNEVLLSYFP